MKEYSSALIFLIKKDMFLKVFNGFEHRILYVINERNQKSNKNKCKLKKTKANLLMPFFRPQGCLKV